MNKLPAVKVQFVAQDVFPDKARYMVIKYIKTVSLGSLLWDCVSYIYKNQCVCKNDWNNFDDFYFDQISE